MNALRATVAIALLGVAAVAHALPSFEEVRRNWSPSDTTVVDRHGEFLQRIRTDATVRRGQWVALQDVSPALRTAMLLSEDKRFHEHSGVDWRAISAAAWGNLWNTRTRGASTITMQLAALIEDEGGTLQRGAGGRTVPQKLGQAVAAKRLERQWRKDQILEAYLNLVPFRGEVVGIDALSRTLFGKAAHGLDEREAAVAAALVRSPNARARVVGQRACGVLRLMQPDTPVDCGGLVLFATASLPQRSFDAAEGSAPHHARRMLGTTDRAGDMPPTVRSTGSPYGSKPV